MRFDGPAYCPQLDKERLTRQLGRIHDLMIDGQWRTLSEIATITGDHEASISADLRHLRKERFGRFIVNKQRRGNKEQGLWEYQVLMPTVRIERQLELVI